jgi:putative hydrolase of the HAD superfamily
VTAAGPAGQDARESEAGADLSHVDTWLFDLDNTLYPLECGLAAQVDARLTQFMIELTGLPPAEALALQKRYLEEHGLTLIGLMKHHDVEPTGFNARFHDLPLGALTRDERLVSAIARLPGRRLIFTNADDVHTQRVLEALGLDHLFDDVFHLISAGYEPKPRAAAFERLIAAHDICPASTAFFEDRAVNLAPAAELGMTTVLVGRSATPAPYVRHLAPDLAAFLADARVKEPA